MFERFRERWIRPALFFGNNPISLIGGAITTASALILIGFWVVDIVGHGGSQNPYLGIIVALILPGLFVLGLILIPVGMFLRRRHLKALGQVPSIYPEVDFSSPAFRHGINFVIVATFINFVIVGTASYRGVAYMDTTSFCGQACHVMTPEYTDYSVSTHSGVACTQCHIAAGFPGYIQAKVNGSKQLFMVILHDYPRPIMGVDKVPPASATCLNCHNPKTFIGDRLVVKTHFADDEQNSETQTVLLLHVGGRDPVGHLSGIHGAHMLHIEYIATDADRQKIPWVQVTNADGSKTVYTASALNGKTPQGRHLVMDCMECHNRPAHSFMTAAQAINSAMLDGSISPSLPFIHKEGLALIQASYSSQDEARTQIPARLEAYYRSQNPQVLAAKADLVRAAGAELATLYTQNVFPGMKITWGTYPNDLGHMNYPGCFRCHDGDHTSKDGKIIPNDCSVCHNVLAMDEAKPKVLVDLGIQ